MLELLAGLILSAIFARNHLFAIIIYICMMLLSCFNMTVMLFPGSHALLIISIFLLLTLFLVERWWKEVKTRRTKTLLNALAIVRYPVNSIYLGDIIFRLHHWGPINDIPTDQPSLGAAIGCMLIYPLAATIIFSIILLVFYAGEIKKLTK